VVLESLIPELAPIVHDSNLTELELLAINSSLNFADGHARQNLTASQARIIDDLPQLFHKCVDTPVDELERTAIKSYFTLLGQHAIPADGRRVLSCYSSSVAMEIVARALVTEIGSLMLLHPTFDNIPDIITGVGIKLVPLAEELLHDNDIDNDLLASVGAVFITTPNNPTGRVVAKDRLRALARQCAEHDNVLVLDTSFRGFDTRAHYDHYEVLEASGCRWIVIEDTGKLWPTLDLKIGWIVTSAHLGSPIPKIHSDILLGVSPFVLALVSKFSADAAASGLADLHRFIAGNRKTVRRALADAPGVCFPDATNRGSVERIQFDARAGSEVWQAMRERNVYLLPCEKFYWADPSAGRNAVRVALARPASQLERAVRELRSVLSAR
jgi:enduracididine biosynthesis enzyme MppP